MGICGGHKPASRRTRTGAFRSPRFSGKHPMHGTSRNHMLHKFSHSFASFHGIARRGDQIGSRAMLWTSKPPLQLRGYQISSRPAPASRRSIFSDACMCRRDRFGLGNCILSLCKRNMHHVYSTKPISSERLRLHWQTRLFAALDRYHGHARREEISRLRPIAFLGLRLQRLFFQTSQFTNLQYANIVFKRIV